jgi:hypothetical protein
VVLVVTDQMRAEFLDRYRPYLGKTGFRRLLKQGREFREARYAHAITTTGPGHSVLGSGQYADRTGIVGNRWYSREQDATVASSSGRIPIGRPSECVRWDGRGEPPEKTSPATAPCQFEGISIAQRLKDRYPKARVVGVSVKDRAAILTTGPGADAAYWFVPHFGGAVGTRCEGYYPDCRKELFEFAREEGLAPYGGRGVVVFERHPEWARWECALPDCEKACPDDVVEAHPDVLGLGRSFPHPVATPQALLHTPFMDEVLESLAERVVEVHDLGRNPSGDPDLLVVSFSALDFLGHLYGPDSCETADAFARLDTTLGRFLSFLDGRVGRKNILLFLSADHGTAPVPEVSRRRGLPAGRVELSARVSRNRGTLADLPDLRMRLEREAAGVLGVEPDPDTPLRDAYVAAFHEPHLYLNAGRIGAGGLPKVRARLKEVLQGVEGIGEVYTWDEIREGRAPEHVRLSFREDRAGDLLVFLDPNWILQADQAATDHGQIYDYDSHVPLIAWGWGVKRGRVETRVDVAQIASTIADLLDLDRSGLSRPDPLPLSGRVPRPEK